jgi:hypothetical protein
VRTIATEPLTGLGDNLGELHIRWLPSIRRI